MQTFTTEDITNYYDHTETHYRQFWKMEQSMGLHYGVWDKDTKTLAEAIVNTNRQLALLGELTANDLVLDAGCGVGGSSIFLAKNIGCQVTGITLSERQVRTASGFAAQNGVAHLARFERMDYTKTRFPDHHFDVVWAIESMQTASDKSLFFKEMQRVLKPGGRLLIADVFKEGNWKITDTPVMQTMLHGWAMSDILNTDQLSDLAKSHSFELAKNVDVTKQVRKSIHKYRWFAMAGMVGTKWYNLFHNATHFSKVHYKTGFAQYRAWKQGLWSYRLLEIRKS
ncbi:MAG: methyltransferase domain-containing protein [Saprospiraceae bacterium]|nr:methyltransferase domain-containing protein [Saprospiraceae bacterium]